MSPKKDLPPSPLPEGKHLFHVHVHRSWDLLVMANNADDAEEIANRAADDGDEAPDIEDASAKHFDIKNGEFADEHRILQHFPKSYNLYGLTEDTSLSKLKELLTASVAPKVETSMGCAVDSPVCTICGEGVACEHVKGDET